METFTTPGPITTTVEVAGAQVRVTASDRTDTVVTVEPLDQASGKDVKVAEGTRVDLAGTRLSVRTTRSGDKNGSVAITIDLPTGSGLAAYLAYSELRAVGSLGDCELHLASGQVVLDRVDALRANLSSGEAAIDHVAGRADIDGGSFTLGIGEAAGPVRFSSSGGRAWIGHASADLDLGSASAGIDIDRADGSVTAETGSGAIRIDRMTNGRATLRNGSGDIEVGIGAGSTASVDINSERGAVHDLVSSEADPGASDAKVSVHARTRHGDITVRRAAS